MKIAYWPARAAICMLGAVGVLFAADTAPAGGSANWSASPDVLAGTIATLPATTAPSASAMIADPYRIKANLAMTPLFNTEREVLIPARPSKYLMTMGSSQSGFELWDLKTGQKERESTYRFDLRDPKLSPDGVHLSGYHFGAADVTGIEIYSIRTGRMETRLTSTARGASPSVLGYLGNDKIIVAWPTIGANMIKTHDVATGKVVHELVVENLPREREYAQSASGKYLVTAIRGVLTMYDLSTCEKLGSLDFGKASDSADPMWRGRQAQAAFSANGQEIALVQVGTGKLRGVIVSATNGSIMSDKSVNLGGTVVNENAPLCWNPDGSCLLMGDAVIDRGSFNVVYQLPKRDKVLYTRWADPTNALIIYRQATRVAFEGVPVSKEQLAKLAGTLAEGGKLEDASLTPLTKVDLSSAPLMSMENAVASPWNVKLWDLAKVSKPIVANFNVKAAVNMPPPPVGASFFRGYDDVATTLLFTSREAHLVFVEHAAVDASSRAGRDSRAKTWIERHDMASGTVNASLELPPGYEALDASDSGKSLVLRSGSEGDRIDVAVLEKGAFKPLVAFRPFGVAEKAQDVNRVAWAGFTDENHVLVESQGMVLGYFELPSAKPVWRAQLVATGQHAGALPALSPDRRLGAICVKNGLCLFDPQTGNAINGLPASNEMVEARGVAFNADGTQVGGILYRKSQPFVMVFDLKSGSTLYDVPIPQGGLQGGAMAFLSPGYILLAGGEVVSLEKKAIIGRYTFPGGGTRVHFGSVNPYERLFYVAPKEGRIPASVVDAALPQEAFVKAAAAITADSIYTWHPGMSVNLNLTVVGDDDFRKVQLAEWTKRLAEQGITIDEKSPNRLTANSFLMDGPATQYTVSRTNETITRPNRMQGYEVSLTVGDKEIWKQAYNKAPEQTSMGPRSVFLSIREGESAQQALERMYPTQKTASAIIVPPMYIFRERVIETVRLGSRGVEAPATAPAPGGRR